MNSPVWIGVIGLAFLGFGPTYYYLMKWIKSSTRDK